MTRRALMLREGKAPVWERLLTMLFLAGLLHGLIILGLTFNAAASDKDSAPGLEVLLVSDEVPEADQNPTATYLAQRTQTGSGNTKKPVKPHNRATALPAIRHPGSADGNSLTTNGDQAGSAEEPVLVTSGWSTRVHYLADLGTAGSVRDRPLLLDEPQTAQPAPEDDPGPAELRGPNRDELWITPDTRMALLAPYLDAWRRKVERIGTRGGHRRRRQDRVGEHPSQQWRCRARPGGARHAEAGESLRPVPGRSCRPLPRVALCLRMAVFRRSSWARSIVNTSLRLAGRMPILEPWPASTAP